MIAIPQHGLVFLAMTKCASTAIEDELSNDGLIITRKNPSLKHMTYRGFKRHLAPMLRRHGYPRRSYEVVSLFREPIEWLHSWYRYRARGELARATGPRQRNYSGNVTFAEFCDAYMQSSAPYATGIGRQANFVRSKQETVGVDRLFRYEELPGFVDYLAEKLGRPIELQPLNVSSRKQKLQIPRELHDGLRAHLATEYFIYETLADGRLIERPKAARPASASGHQGDDGDAKGSDGDTLGGQATSGGQGSEARSDRDAGASSDAAVEERQPVQADV